MHFLQTGIDTYKIFHNIMSVFKNNIFFLKISGKNVLEEMELVKLKNILFSKMINGHLIT